MKRAIVAVALLATMSLGGCAVYPAAPYAYYPPAPVVTVYQQPYVYPRYDPGYANQYRWQRWYDCQRYYGNYGRCAY